MVPYPIFIEKGKPFQIVNLWVPFNKRWIDPAGEYLAILEDGNLQTYLIADKMQWYRVTTGTDAHVELLAEHMLGELPFTYVMGLPTECEETKIEYQESIISSTYEYCDEAAVAHSTDQAVRLKMNSILTRPVTSCLDCNGTGKKEEQGLQSKDCQTCGGTGHAIRPGDYSDLVYKPADFNDDNSKVPRPEYINPDTSVAEFHSKTWKEYIAMAKRTCGIDSLIDQQESGEAMKQRLATLESFIQYIISLHYQFVLKKYLELVFKLLEWNNPDNWKDLPTIKTPTRIEIKTPEILKENFKTAIPVEKIQAGLDYFEIKYANNPKLFRAMRLTIETYPSSLFEAADLEALKMLNTFSETEIARGIKAFLVFKRIVFDEKNTEKKDDKIIELAQAELETMIPEKIEITLTQ